MMPFVLPRLIEKGSKGWIRRREGKLKELAPKFCARGYKAAREKLVSRVGRPLLESSQFLSIHMPMICT